MLSPSAADTLSVRSVPEGGVSLRPGAPLRLRCQVSGVGAWKRSALQVQWMRRGPAGEVEVARVDPDGVVAWGDDLSRAGGGGSMEREADGRFSLGLFSVRPADAGLYRCAVSVYAGRKTPAPESPATITQRSEWVTVSLKTEGACESLYLHLAIEQTLLSKVTYNGSNQSQQKSNDKSQLA